MGWKECCIMDERIKFVAQVMEGESMSSVCREFGVSRKTGYKIYNRYIKYGLDALKDQTRRPCRLANQLPLSIEKLILRLKKEKPHWGAPKLRERFIRKFSDLKPPAISTIHAVLDRNGLVTKRPRRARHRACGTGLSVPVKPNDLWCVDFKGQFLLGNKQYCYPLTVTDSVSRFIFSCEALSSTQEQPTFPVFEELFTEYGLPIGIRSDNGVPFATPNGLFNLSRLSAWWLRLGIAVERTEPGNPQQNGRHERMHRTLKKEATKPAGENLLQQQAKFDQFIEEFNTERPHESLAMKCPAECYTKSERLYEGLQPVDYPNHDRTISVTKCGAVCLESTRIYMSNALAGQPVGVTQIDDYTWSITFMDYDLGYLDTQSKRFEHGANPFCQKVLPMSPV